MLASSKLTNVDEQNLNTCMTLQKSRREWKCRTWNCRTWKYSAWICKTWGISYEDRLHYIRVCISVKFQIFCM